MLDNTGGFQMDKFFGSVGVFIGVFSGSFFLGFIMGLVTALVSLLTLFLDVILYFMKIELQTIVMYFFS